MTRGPNNLPVLASDIELHGLHPSVDNLEVETMILDISTLELNIFFALSVILIVVKGGLLGFLSKKEMDHAKAAGKFSFGFVLSVIVLLICLIISRFIYIIFDFVLTNLDPSRFYGIPAVWYWKAATVFATVGYAVFIFVTDYRIFKFKFRGIFAYLLVAFAISLFFYPVYTKGDFDFLSMFLLGANCVTIILPVFFLYMGRKRSPYQIPSLCIAFGIVIYAIGASITTESLIVSLVSTFGEIVRLVIYFSSLILKIAGLVMFAYGVSRFASKFSK